MTMMTPYGVTGWERVNAIMMIQAWKHARVHKVVWRREVKVPSVGWEVKCHTETLLSRLDIGSVENIALFDGAKPRVLGGGGGGGGGGWGGNGVRA